MLRLWLVLTVAAWVAPGTVAQARPDEPTLREARALYESGLGHYHLGEFDAAINDFKAAYTISHAPRLLFDIAQAQRLSRQHEAALYSYQTYLRLVPDAPNRADVNARIGELTKILAEQPRPAEAPLPTPSPSPVSVPTVEVRPDSRMRWAGVGVLAGGVALLAAAAGCTAVAAGDGDELRGVQMMHGMWGPHEEEVLQRGTRSQTAAIALWAIGGATVVVGAIVTAAGSRRPAHREEKR